MIFSTRSRIRATFLSLLLLPALTMLSRVTFASEAKTDASVVYLKKIRDEDQNYLRQTTINVAQHIESSDDFDAIPFKANVVGTVITVSSPTYSFETVRDGMSASDIAGAGLSIVADVGGLFGKSKEANSVRRAERSSQNNRTVFNQLKKGEQVKVTLTAKITLIDQDADINITRTLNVHDTYDSEDQFISAKESQFERAVKQQLSLALTEYHEEPAF